MGGLSSFYDTHKDGLSFTFAFSLPKKFWEEHQNELTEVVCPDYAGDIN